MHQLLNSLIKDGATWAVTSVTEDQKNGAGPRPGIQATLTLPGEAPLTRNFGVHTEVTLERMIVLLLKEHRPKHPGLRAWLDSKGNVPVALTQDALEYVAEHMHTALRKLADSKQSVITWNGLHHLHPQDRHAMWTEVREYLTKAFANPKPPLRRNLALGLQECLVNFFNDRGHVAIKDDDGREVMRNQLDTFALLSMYAACSLTDLDEWMWGWLGYVLEDIPREEPPEAAAAE